jgi:hypothetical protein
LEECRKSGLFKQLVIDLKEKIKNKLREEDTSVEELESLREYMDNEEKFKNLEDRLACLISNKT